MNDKNNLPPKDDVVKEKPVVQKAADLKSQNEELARIIAKLSAEDPALIADVIKKWLEENKK